MKLLGIDTSTDACSVALLIDGQLVSDHRIVAQQHGALVLPMIDALIAQAGVSVSQLDALIYGRGPGSFTGVRIGVATAQGIALGADIGVVGISTLQSIAQACWREHSDEKVAVSVDARMEEVYLGQFSLDADGLMQAVVDEQITAPDQLDSCSSPVWVGSGAERYADFLPPYKGSGPPILRSGYLPNAVDLLTLGSPSVLKGETLAAERASPVYLRDKVALTTAERSSV